LRSSMFTSDSMLILLALSSSWWMITPVLIAPGPISTKVGTNHPSAKGIQNCTNKG
jgi:hypothetical protein